MLAIECSKPAEMKASRPHHRTMSLAPSLAARAAIHRARQTSMLQSTARMNSWPPVRLCLAVAMPARAALNTVTLPAGAPAVTIPEAFTSTAKPRAPTKLPTREATHTRATSTEDTFFRRKPCSMIMLLPVNSSAPGEDDEREGDAEHRALHELGEGVLRGDERGARP